VALAGIAAALLYSSGATLALGTAAISAAPGIWTFVGALAAIGGILVVVAGVMALMFDRMAAFGKAIKGTAADSRAMADALREAGYAAILNGNPIALAGLAAQTLYAKATKTTVNVGGGKNLKAMAEGMEKTATLAATFEGVAANMTAIADGIGEIDTAIGSGKRRVEIISTLTALASLSTAEVGNSAVNRQMAANQQAQQTIKVSVENEFKDLKFVIDDGKGVKTFQAYIKAQIPSVRR